MFSVRCRGLAVVGLVLGLSSCFYDSRWGQQKASQKHEAARQTPEQLRAQTASLAPRLAERTLRLRVYATPAYTSTVVDWQKQFADTLDCANSVFTPQFGARLEVAEFVPFRPRANEEKLDGLLAELRASDAASDVDWAIGLARAVPQFAASADDLGLAPLLGNHLVMRAMSDAHEYEAIQRAFTELSEEERLKLYHTRKLHKLCAVFLHEVAHTLGVPHELSESSLMHPRYHVKTQGYSDEAAIIVRAALDLRTKQPPALLDPSFAQLLSSSMSTSDANWEPTSRDGLLLQLTSFRNNGGANTRTATATTTATTAATATTETTGLNPDEQRSYDQARAELAARHGLAARQIAAPLLTKHGNLPAIRALRCDIAMSIGGDWETLSAECAGLSALGKVQ
jgi:hypothetical protein